MHTTNPALDTDTLRRIKPPVQPLCHHSHNIPGGNSNSPGRSSQFLQIARAAQHVMCTLAPLQYIVGNVPSDRTYLEQGEVLKCFLIHANEIETNKPLHSCTLSTFRVPMVKLTQFHTGSFSYQVEDRHIPFSQLCLLKHVKLWKCSLTGMGKDTRHFATSCQCSGYLTDS